MAQRERGTTRVAVVVSSCDAFADVWEPFFALFRRYWPDCPYPVYLITNHRRYLTDRVTSIQVGDDQKWASNLRVAVEKIPAPILLYLQEDYLLMKPVSTRRIARYVTVLEETQASYLRLYPSPGPDQPLPGYTDVGLITPGAEYRASLQAALWRKTALAAVLRDGESGWQMESLGSRRSDALPGAFLSVVRDSCDGSLLDPPLAYYATGIVRGKWVPDAVALCRREGIPIDLEARKARTVLDRMGDAIKRMMVQALRFLRLR